MATQYQLPALTLNFVDASGGEQTSLVRAVVQGDKGKTQFFSLWNGTAQWTGQPSELGFEASKPDGNFVDVRSGYDQAGTGFMLTIPDETFTKDGRVVCHVYAYDSEGTIKAQSQAFTYDVKKVLYYDGTSNSFSKDYEQIVAQAKTDLADFQAKITAVSTDDVVKDAQNKVLADIATWEASTKDSITGDFAGLKALQQQWTQVINGAQTTYESLAAKANAMDSATDDSKQQTKAAKEATAGAVQAKEDAEAVIKTTKAAGDEAAEQAKVAKDAAAMVTDQQADIDTNKQGQTNLDAKLVEAQKSFDALDPATLVKSPNGYLTGGGVNLYAGSRDWSGNWSANLATVTREVVDGETVLHIVAPQNDAYSGVGSVGVYVSCPTGLVAGDEFAVGISLKGSGLLTRIGMASVTDHTLLTEPVTLSENWVRVTNQMVAKSKGTIIIYFKPTVGIDAYARCLQIEHGKVAHDYLPDPVTDVGGQYPVGGHINMGAYATKGGNNSFSGSNDFASVPTIGGLKMIVPVFQRALVSSDDLFTTLEADGLYSCNGNADGIANWPTGASPYGRLQKETFSGTTILTWRTYSGTWTCCKSGSPAKWGSWEKIATSANITELNNKISALQAQLSGGAQPD